MGEHISNLLIGTGTSVNSNGYRVVTYKTTEPLVHDTTYTICAYIEELECEGDTPKLYVYDGNGHIIFGILKGDIPGMYTMTFTYNQNIPGQYPPDPNNIAFFNTIPYNDAKRKAVLHHVMLVKGTEPAAWAPAEGETLTADAGGG